MGSRLKRITQRLNYRIREFYWARRRPGSGTVVSLYLDKSESHDESIDKSNIVTFDKSNVIALTYTYNNPIPVSIKVTFSKPIAYQDAQRIADAISSALPQS